MALALLAGGVAASAGAPRPSTEGVVNGPTASTPVLEPAADRRAGSVTGTVTVAEPPRRRTARRYPGGGGGARAVQPLPVLVWVAGASADAPPIEAVMEQRDTAFAPAAQVVPVGSTIRFPNRDPFFHNVFSYSGTARFDLGRYPRGEAKSVTFDEPGVVKIYCEVHEFMRAVVVVTRSRHQAVVGADGSYRLDGLPAGRHTLVFWHSDLGEVERTVTVAEGSVTRLDVRLE